MTHAPFAFTNHKPSLTMKDKYKKRRLSAVRDFPKYCGYNATFPIDKEEKSKVAEKDTVGKKRKRNYIQEELQVNKVEDAYVFEQNELKVFNNRDSKLIPEGNFIVDCVRVDVISPEVPDIEVIANQKVRNLSADNVDVYNSMDGHN